MDQKLSHNWVKILSTTQSHFIHLVSSMLDEAGIVSFIINKSDSMLPANGISADFDLYVKKEDALQAKQIAEKAKK